MTIVTAADQSHFLSLIQLLRSISLHEPEASLLVYDLGFTKHQTAELHEISQLLNLRIEVSNFHFSAYPEYFLLENEAGSYAWKPVIVEAALASCSTNLLYWLDAGDIITKRTNKARLAGMVNGIWSPISAGTLRDWTHKSVADKFGIDTKLGALRNRNGAIVVINCADPRAIGLVSLWAELARNKNWIAPPGSSRANHRQDQSLISLLMVQSRMSMRPTEINEIWIQQDVEPETRTQ